MPWSIFTQGGGTGAAVTWAQKLQNALGIPVNDTDTQFIYDWEVSEGGGGAFNPLNQGPVPGHPELTTTGPQYGGGAADFAGWDAGIQGAVDYLNMPAYAGVLKGLQDQSYSEAETNLWNSPWAASHYGYGANWSTEAPPGATPLPISAFSGPISTTLTSQDTSSPQSGGSGILGSLIGLTNPQDTMERLGLILLGGALILLGVYMLVGRQTLQLTGNITGGVGGLIEGQQRRNRRRVAETQRVTGGIARIEREQAAERRRGEREQRQGRDEAREAQRLSLRERRIALAERTEARHSGG